METNKIKFTKTSGGKSSFVDKIKNITHSWIAGNFFNYSLILSFFVSIILIYLTFNLPSNTKAFGFYKFVQGESHLSAVGIIAIIIFSIQALSNIRYIVKFCIEKDNHKKITHIVFLSSIFLLSLVVLIFGITNNPGTIIPGYSFTAWIYEFTISNDTWSGFEYTIAGSVLVSLTVCIYFLAMIFAYLTFKKNINISKIFKKKSKE